MVERVTHTHSYAIYKTILQKLTIFATYKTFEYCTRIPLTCAYSSQQNKIHKFTFSQSFLRIAKKRKKEVIHISPLASVGVYPVCMFFLKMFFSFQINLHKNKTVQLLEKAKCCWMIKREKKERMALH